MLSLKRLRPFMMLAAGSLTIVFSSCTGASKTFNNAEKWLPSDFEPKTYVLLVDTAGIKGKQVKKMAAHLQKKYRYQYQFVSVKDVESNAAYSDVNKYRFLMVFTNYTAMLTTTTSSGMMRTRNLLMLDFYFQDRLNKIKYPNSLRGSSWAPPTFNAMINTILKERKG